MKRVLAILVMLVLMVGMSYAETETYWVLCNPTSFVNIRETPRNGNNKSGFLLYGDKVECDGKKRNGYWHIVNVSNEMGDGWVKGLYLVDEQPGEPIDDAYVVVANGRVASRNGVNGKRTKWLKPDTVLNVYGVAGDWAVTDIGYVKVSFLEVVGN